LTIVLCRVDHGALVITETSVARAAAAAMVPPPWVWGYQIRKYPDSDINCPAGTSVMTKDFVIAKTFHP
jgi:hypothetical protein